MSSKAMPSYTYQALFFDYLAIGSARSARAVTQKVVELLAPRSVLDVGCGAGAWLREYLNRDVADCLGIDGDYVKPESLLIPEHNFRRGDVSKEFALGRRFDLAQCLEVGEHLPEKTSKTLVSNLVTHSDRVLFSAAVPGQAGENHINEQSYEFWRQLFAEHGYLPFDFIRHGIRRMQDVEPWYRYNLVLYVKRSTIPSLPPSVAQSQIPEGVPIPDVSPAIYRARKAILRCLPIAMASRLAILKHRSLITLHRLKRGL